jgi:outer membrane protein W
LLLVAALSLVLGGAAEAREGYIVRFAGASVNPTGDLRIDESEIVPLGDGTTLEETTRATIEADRAFGFCIDLERRFNDRFGLGFTIMWADHDVDATGSESVRITDDATNAVLFDTSESVTLELGNVDMMPLLIGGNFHFGANGKVDVYAGPFVGLVTFGDLMLDDQRIGFKDDFAWGGTLGLDVPFRNGKAAFSASARYMIADAESDEIESQTLELDPLVVMFGLGYRF